MRLATDLWAVHIEGPDSIIAAEDFDDAQRHANEINKLAEGLKHVRFAPTIRAYVVPWPATAEAHAAELADPTRWETIG